LDKIIPKNNDRIKKAEPYMEILRIRLIRFTWLVENFIHKNNMQLIRNDADGKLQKVSGWCLILSSDHYFFSLKLPRKSVKHSSWEKLSYCFKL